ncbi:MAG: Dihydrolipoyl dehydrogenase [Herminiimonas sp.]|nr:Dihydrolipoyl dehydrogenase [Herminiimonas sp.]
MAVTEVKVPDIGDFKEVEVIELLVKPGDTIKVDQSMITVESDKASMEIPSDRAGVVKELKIKLGDKVAMGSVVLTLEAGAEAGGAAPGASPAASPAVAPAAAAPAASAQASASAKPAASSASPAASPAPAPASFSGKADIECDTLVLGAGPGGYTAAFRAADLGQKVVLVERYAALGGVCLNVGCIPSKALLHAAKVITEAEEMSHFGVKMSKPEVDVNALRGWKEGIVKKLTGGLTGLARARKVQVVHGEGAFSSANTLTVETAEGSKTIAFRNAIIAAGSSVARIPGFPYDDPRLIDSTGALQLDTIPKRMLVIGGGIIGLEMACVYDALGTKVSVVEFLDGLIPSADRDIVKPLQKRIEKRYEAIYLKTKVTKLEARPNGLIATFEGENAPKEAQTYDAVLMAVGRRPNGKEIAAEKAGVVVNERGFIPVDRQQRTNVGHIFAIGDIVGDPMLAHKATNEAKVAAEVIAGHKVEFDALTIPSVAYTDPEIAWMGLTETEAKAKGIPYGKASFPWAASGRALAMGRDDGVTKLLWDPETKRIIGAGIVGVNAGELLAETVLAMEMGADLEDLALTIHSHPTLSETPMFAAEMGLGTITDLYIPKK